MYMHTGVYGSYVFTVHSDGDKRHVHSAWHRTTEPPSQSGEMGYHMLMIGLHCVLLGDSYQSATHLDDVKNTTSRS